MLNIYYRLNSDYNNKNRFHDLVERTGVGMYNSFTSSTEVDLYYKENNRLQTIKFGASNIITLALNGNNLNPNLLGLRKLDSRGVKITYLDNNTILEQPTITIE
jgi:hypothetical protein